MDDTTAKEFPEKRTSMRQRFLRKRPEDLLPLTITHQRIYILPSKRGWFYIFSLLIMLVASLNYAINLGFALCFLLTGLVASSLLSTYQNLAGTEVVSADVEPTFVNDHLRYRLRFHNRRSVGRLGVKVTTTLGVEDIFSITANSTTTSELTVLASNRGVQHLGRITLSSDYPIGLWYGWSYFHAVCKGIVYPEIEAKAPAAPESDVNSEQKNRPQKKLGTEEFSELRTYQAGDPQSQIAWKAVARGQGWFSKSFTEDTGTSRYHFDFNDTLGLSDIEQRLSRLTAWIVSAEHRGVQYSLSLPGFHSALDSGTKHRDKLLEKLALYGIDSEQ